MTLGCVKEARVSFMRGSVTKAMGTAFPLLGSLHPLLNPGKGCIHGDGILQAESEAYACMRDRGGGGGGGVGRLELQLRCCSQPLIAENVFYPSQVLA